MQTTMTAMELKSRRERLGYSRELLAEVLGVAARSLAQWEEGQLAPEHAETVAEALDALERHGAWKSHPLRQIRRNRRVADER